MEVVVLQEWFVRFRHNDGWCAPECNYKVLAGKLMTKHKGFLPGDEVKTSAIDVIKGRIITTASGTSYRLGRINPKYRRWMKKQGIEYDPKNPIKDKR
jgi:hypothetical protein